MVKVKICGLTNLSDALYAAEQGADLLGFVFAEGTPRCVRAGDVSAISKELREKGVRAGKVGLFLNAPIGEVIDAVRMCGLDHVQLHGEESPGYCGSLKADTGVKIIKAFKVGKEGIVPVSGDPRRYTDADYFLFDTYDTSLPGGTGRRFEEDALSGIEGEMARPVIIAGGLTPDNVADTIRRTRPYGVDVSSGVESAPRRKDPILVKEFIENAKNA